MDVTSFAEIEEEFMARVRRIAWCTVATVDLKGRPRTRILHPIWEGATGWIATGRHSHKEKHLARNPYVSLSYWDPQHQQIYVDASAAWEDDAAEKRRIWDLYKSTPPPLGYDPQIIWQKGVEDPEFGVLKLTPWRIELSALGDMVTGAPPKVWRPTP
jgi:general stress protein 26